MSKKRIPIVAIVGRANVGKSSLFNTLLGTREAVVAKEAGTTRDAVWQLAQHDGRSFWLVDTAGMKSAEDEFELSIQQQITEASDSADCIIVVVEATGSITHEDRRVAKIALKSEKSVILVVNKSDKLKKLDIEVYKKLGIKNILFTSTTQKKGISELKAEIIHTVPATDHKDQPDVVAVSILGRPNVGKSSLFNRLLKKQQAVVSEVAGTTRDVNRRTVHYHKTAIELADTAGIRRSGKIEKGVEQFSVLRSLQAIERSDVCLLVIDGTEPSVQLDQKIAGMIKEANKGLVLVVSKWDIAKEATEKNRITKQLQHDFSFVPWAPVIFTSSETGQNVTKLFDLILDIRESQATKIKTRELNNWLARVTRSHSPAGLKNRRPKLRYMLQEDDNPTNFKVYGSHTKFLHWSYKRYMERELRAAFGFEGTGVRLWFFDGSEPKRDKKSRKD
jgi:GTPase